MLRCDTVDLLRNGHRRKRDLARGNHHDGSIFLMLFKDAFVALELCIKDSERQFSDFVYSRARNVC